MNQDTINKEDIILVGVILFSVTNIFVILGLLGYNVLEVIIKVFNTKDVSIFILSVLEVIAIFYIYIKVWSKQ